MAQATSLALQSLAKALTLHASSSSAISSSNAAAVPFFLATKGGPLFFASMSTVSTPLTVVASGMAKWLELYSAVMMIRVLLSWFPNIPWEKQPFMAIRDMCDPYLNLFRNIIPPVFNALDLSPLLAFMVLGTMSSILNSAAQT
ncbi:ylmG homolog protein 1-1, chloroplastic [Selaginella moellendorffii]|nr:ylmG homolog protein 1-1, chloroplastic [Selaginella moellendorffii]|eukprot:XP_002989440.2 ylmG homolog protein 1-1, chloroplastic [Selaginella moellendorffii]